MPTVRKQTFDLPEEKASYIDSLVAAGTYATSSDVVSAGLEALQDRNATMEEWLREEALPVFDAMQADPSRGRSPEQVEAALLAHHEERMRNGSK